MLRAMRAGAGRVGFLETVRGGGGPVVDAAVGPPTYKPNWQLLGPPTQPRGPSASAGTSTYGTLNTYLRTSPLELAL